MPLAGDEIFLDDFLPQLGPWTAFTPTYGAAGGSPAIGNGSLVGRYLRMGKTVFYVARMTWGSTTVTGTSFLRFGLPSTPNAAIDYIGSAMLLDVSAGTAGYLTSTSMASAVPYVLIGAPTGGLVTNTIPFTLASGDIVRWAGTYEEP
ncbi:hypothetical protein HH310_12610 [Actinoplanes sp. TBRC 11911]|uniref:hypothetical protein n=1 Tax=Actinoplanes sp. TBRC 11911 TaxID=2729386 RepID=UPI00145EB922|nr:hypothetical protein [Actinoplanes sp. TBRC 11911]NMO52035.1 hypothetical protein [Actinoplanes sp. TBRC 11911]